MAANNFLERRPASPMGFGMVLALHAAAIAGVVMIKNPVWNPPADPTDTYNVPIPPDPDPVPPPEPAPRDQVVPPPQPRPFIPDPVVPSPPVNPPIASDPRPAEPPPLPTRFAEAAGTGSGTGTAVIPPPRPLDPPPPVRVAAMFDPRFASAMQPPYPASEQRAEREGSVRVRVTIASNGRVTAVQRLSATSDAFWRATEAQALSRWRFRPATEDGRPVESTKELTVHFRLDT